jgi:hypothetical protein
VLSAEVGRKLLPTSIVSCAPRGAWARGALDRAAESARAAPRADGRRADSNAPCHPQRSSQIGID